MGTVIGWIIGILILLWIVAWLITKIAAAISPDVREQQRQEKMQKRAAKGKVVYIKDERNNQPDSNTKKCPFCAETIQAEAIKCRYCGSDLRNV